MKCPFCEVPCKQEHCPYYEEFKLKEYQKNLKGLQEENIRLKQTILDLQEYIRNKK